MIRSPFASIFPERFGVFALPISSAASGGAAYQAWVTQATQLVQLMSALGAFVVSCVTVAYLLQQMYNNKGK